MKVIKLKNVVIPTVPDNVPPYASRPIPKKGIPLCHLAGVVGGTGSGKTTSLLQFLMWYDKAGTFDRLIIFSPTLSREDKGKHFLKAKHHFEISYYPEYTDALMMEERGKMLADIEDWHKFEEMKKAWAKFCRVGTVDDMTMQELVLLEEMDFKKPKWKYPKEFYPTFALVLDDHVGKPGVLNANCRSKLVEVCVEHRHLSLSIYLLSQVFQNFIPKQLRGGCINLWILFSTKSEKHMEDIAESVVSKIEPERFIQAWKYATKDSPHDFLLVDYKCNDVNFMLRKGFDKIIQFSDADASPEAEE